MSNKYIYRVSRNYYNYAREQAEEEISYYWEKPDLMESESATPMKIISTDKRKTIVEQYIDDSGKVLPLRISNIFIK